MSGGTLSYFLVEGTYLIGDNEVSYYHKTRIKTADVVLKLDDRSAFPLYVVYPPEECEIPSRIFTVRATEQEIDEKKSDYFLEHDAFEEFKRKLIQEMTKSGPRIDPSEFAKYRIGKGMTANNVTELLCNVFKDVYNVRFRQIREASHCHVVTFDDYYVEPGDELDYAEDVIILFHSDYFVPLPPMVPYVNERSKALAYLHTFSEYDFDKAKRTVIKRSTPLFDVAYLFRVLNFYYGRVEEATRHYQYY